MVYLERKGAEEESICLLKRFCCVVKFTIRDLVFPLPQQTERNWLSHLDVHYLLDLFPNNIFSLGVRCIHDHANLCVWVCTQGV